MYVIGKQQSNVGMSLMKQQSNVCISLGNSKVM